MKFLLASALVKLGFSVSHLARVSASTASWERERGPHVPEGGSGRGNGGGLDKGSPAKNKLKAILSSGIGHAFEKNSFDVGILSKQPGNVTWPTSVEDCDEFVECVYGYAGNETCAEACGGDCCVGDYACDGFSGKVCKDQTSCNGASACFFANIGEVHEGCNGDSACTLAGYLGKIEKVVNGCRGVSYGSSCYAAGLFYGEIKEIRNSCRGDVTCVFAGSYGGKIGTMYESCIGERWSCWRLADGGEVGNVADSCQGISACDRLSYYGEVGDLTGACKSLEACYFAGESGSITEFVDACNGDYGCFDLAYYGLVGGVRAACNAEEACLGAGSESSGDIPSGIIECCNEAGECEGANEASLPDQCVTVQQPTTPPTTVPPTPAPTPGSTPPPVTASPTTATMSPTPPKEGTSSPTDASASKSGKKGKTGKSGKASKGSKNGVYQSMNLYEEDRSSSMSFRFL